MGGPTLTETPGKESEIPGTETETPGTDTDTPGSEREIIGVLLGEALTGADVGGGLPALALALAEALAETLTGGGI